MKLTTNRREALQRVEDGWLYLSHLPTANWLKRAGLIAWFPAGWCITDAGREALRQPFATKEAGDRACDRWRRKNPGRAMGWLHVPCIGGGWAIRVGCTGQRSVLLPEGIDPALIKKDR